MRPNKSAVLLTGGAGGIALRTAQYLARADETLGIVLLDRNAEALAVASQSLADRPGRTLTFTVDVADSSSVDRAVAEADAELGGLTGVVAAAGVRMPNTSLLEVTDALWHDVYSSNLLGCFNTVRAGARAMVARGEGGSVVTIASLSGTRARLGQSAYCTNKAAIIHLTSVLALEVAQHGITANAICPGTVRTAMLEKAIEQDGPDVVKVRVFGSSEKFRPGIPRREIAEPDDLAALIEFLFSPRARHITGEAIHIDGGEHVI